MMKSMTGFGKSVCELNDKIITIEVKSLNSKQLDLYTRIPGIYREKDMDIRNIVTQRLKRGKVEVNLLIESTGAKDAGKINMPVVLEYFRQLKDISDKMEIELNDSVLQIIMRLPESLKIDKVEVDTEEWGKIVSNLNSALDSVEKFREQEGTASQNDMLDKVSNILELLDKIKPFEGERMKLVRQKLETSMNEISDTDKIDSNRFEQELIYYLERLDLNEEEVRLRNHCSFFKEVCLQDEPVGRKLGFITQEMGREINTMGSKANHSDIQRLVVMMKDELEKIKEQTLNIL